MSDYHEAFAQAVRAVLKLQHVKQDCWLHLPQALTYVSQGSLQGVGYSAMPCTKQFHHLHTKQLPVRPQPVLPAM